MSQGFLINLMRNGITEILMLIAPPLVVALAVGLIVAVFQAVTSIQEQTLTFLPKLVCILLVISLLSGWMFTHLSQYTVHLFNLIPVLAR